MNSTGSFKRFESIDREYKPGDEAPVQSPSWNITVPEIPPQPLRLAPKSPTFHERKKSPQKHSPETQRFVLSPNIFSILCCETKIACK